VTLPVYFLSDAHLGGEPPAREGPKERALIAFLDARAPGETVYVLGDLFDFWFEDGAPPPARFDAVLRALGRAADRGVRVRLMGGNHDYWVRGRKGPGWLERELGIEILDDPHFDQHHGRRLYLCHGDALGGAEGGYRLLRGVLRNPLAIVGFGILPRALGRRIAALASKASRRSHDESDQDRRAARLRERAAAVLAGRQVDAVVAGHVHRPELRRLAGGEYLNIGDWMVFRTYGVLRDGALALERFEEGAQPRR
jgi:UDP-2,3-diacylglucosamine hydrolase